MSSQIFKKIYPKQDFIEFLKSYCEFNNQYLVFSKSSFKKMKINNQILPLFNTLKNYYHVSKLFYLERKPIYKNFVTIIKHVCKINNIPYDSKILYYKSSYELTYKIYYNFTLK
jgi:hypothetical protein